MIRVLICDGDGTLQLPSPSTEIQSLLDKLDELNIVLAVATNRGRRRAETLFRDAGMRVPRYIVAPTDVGGEKKPSPRFIEEISQMTGFAKREMLYLGDDDNTDILCAINAGVLPANAMYSTSGKQQNYGLQVINPARLETFLATFGQQQDPYFGWTFNSTCAETRKPIDVRTLLDRHGWDSDIVRVLKGESVADDSKRKSIVLALGLGLVSSCYQSGLMEQIDWITTYPGHTSGPKKSLTQTYSRMLARLFRDKYQADLLVRHKDAPQSRYAGSGRNIVSQLNTIKVNDSLRKRIIGKRVLVVDDFTTSGYSFETARRMLVEAGCDSVVCLAFGKFRNVYEVATLGRRWDPFIANTFERSAIGLSTRSGDRHPETDEFFQNTVWPEYVG